MEGAQHMREFDGRTALVTGAAQGVGRAVAELLAARGAAVVAVDVSPDVAALATDAVRPMVVDLAEPAALAGLMAELAPHSPVDLLVNNAATYPPGGLLDSTDTDWARVMRVNALVPASLSRWFAARLRADGRPGAIVNVGSVQETLPLPDHSAYVTSKGALSGLTAALAVELGEHGIRVNEVRLGLISSPALERKVGDEIWDVTAPPTLLGRTGTLREAAEAIAFLGSDRASYITGAVLSVDGGRRLSRRPDAQMAPRKPAGAPTVDPQGGHRC